MKVACVAVAALVIGTVPVWAQGPLPTPPATGATAYQCRGMTGTSIMAPDWAPDRDGATGQVVRLEYRPDATATVTWSRQGGEYSRDEGVVLPMTPGWAIQVVHDERVETYVLNAATQQLLFSQTRMGSQLLPDIVKAYRGTCTADAIN